MLIGLLMLLLPVVVFILTLPFSGRFRPVLCKIYRIFGGIVVILGSSISLYLAAYTGDQGGIGALYFQILVIFLYVVFSMSLILLNLLLNIKDSRKK